jgi:hypothetical protein
MMVLNRSKLGIFILVQDWNGYQVWQQGLLMWWAGLKLGSVRMKGRILKS